MMSGWKTIAIYLYQYLDHIKYVNIYHLILELLRLANVVKGLLKK
jgi:hypothetical protein